MGCCPDGKTAVNPCIKYILLVGTFVHWVFILTYAVETCLHRKWSVCFRICRNSVVLQLSGLAMVAIGAWAFNEKNKYFYQPISDVYDVIFDLSLVLIAFGAIMFIITMCGFVGALRENTCLLRVFYYSLAIIFLLEVIAGALGLAFKDKAIEFVGGVLKKGYVDQYQDDEDAVIDWFQENFKCCGIDSYTDWNRNEYFNCTPSNPSQLSCAVPYSCCKNPYELSPGLVNVFCGANALSADSMTTLKVYRDGCVQKILTLAEENLPTIAGVIIAIAVPQLMGIILGHIFANQIEKQWSIYYKEHRSGHRYR